MVELKIEGLAELRKALLELPKELHKGPLRAAVSAGAGVVQKKARELAPSGEGTLKRAIYRTRSREGSSAVQEMAIVGIRYGKRYRRRGLDAWYWRFIEFGTKRHAIRTRAGVLADADRNLVFGRTVQHPGVKMQPFLRPAFEQTKDAQVETLRARLAKAIERVADKLKRR